MYIDKSKFNLVKSQEKYKGFLTKKSLTDVKAQVVSLLDISGSMKNYYPNEMQDVVNYLAAVAFSLDDNGELDTYLFSERAEKIENVTMSNLDSYVKKEILNKEKSFHWHGTSYSPFMQDILDDFFNKTYSSKEQKSFFGFIKNKINEEKYDKNSKDNYPVYVIILTDGVCDDATKTEDLINSAKDSNIYWQFIGVTKHNNELKQIEQWGEKYSNVGFFKFSDLYSMDENKLYENLVSSEFISFIKKENA